MKGIVGGGEEMKGIVGGGEEMKGIVGGGEEMKGIVGGGEGGRGNHYTCNFYRRMHGIVGVSLSLLPTQTVSSAVAETGTSAGMITFVLLLLV